MNFSQHVDTFKSIQNALLEYIDNQDNVEIYYQNLINIIKKNKNHKDEFKSFICILSMISSNHHRYHDFFDKIFKILDFVGQDIKTYLSNSEIFDLFKDNKRIILYLLDTKMITIDKTVKKQMEKQQKNDENYQEYFFPDMLYETPKNFEEKRLFGENESYICSLIRDDLVEEFISYVSQSNLPLSTTVIKKSLFETNSFLIGKEVSLIEYCAFYGSIQIFQFLIMSKVKPTPSLWLFVIHSNNADMIHLLENLHVEPEDKKYEECLNESIKYHHNNIANYIKNNFANEESIEFNLKYVFDNNFIECCFRYNNFSLLDEIDYENRFFFYYLCKYNYFELVKLYLSNYKRIDLNETVVFLIQNFLNRIQNSICFEYNSKSIFFF